MSAGKARRPGSGEAVYRTAPYTGKRNRAGRLVGRDRILALVRLRRFSSAVLPSPTQANLRTSVSVFKAWRNLSVRCGVVETKPEGKPLPPADGSPLRPENMPGGTCTSLIVQMSSGRLFLDGLLASIARLRFTGTASVTPVFWTRPETGHFSPENPALPKGSGSGLPGDQSRCGLKGDLVSQLFQPLH